MKMGMWIAIGTAIGIGVGAAMDNISMGAATGPRRRLHEKPSVDSRALFIYGEITRLNTSFRYACSWMWKCVVPAFSKPCLR